jgi:hypothetical protein
MTTFAFDRAAAEPTRSTMSSAASPSLRIGGAAYRPEPASDADSAAADSGAEKARKGANGDLEAAAFAMGETKSSV